MNWIRQRQAADALLRASRMNYRDRSQITNGFQPNPGYGRHHASEELSRLGLIREVEPAELSRRVAETRAAVAEAAKDPRREPLPLPSVEIDKNTERHAVEWSARQLGEYWQNPAYDLELETRLALKARASELAEIAPTLPVEIVGGESHPAVETLAERVAKKAAEIEERRAAQAAARRRERGNEITRDRAD